MLTFRLAEKSEKRPEDQRINKRLAYGKKYTQDAYKTYIDVSAKGTRGRKSHGPDRQNWFSREKKMCADSKRLATSGGGEY